MSTQLREKDWTPDLDSFGESAKVTAGPPAGSDYRATGDLVITTVQNHAASLLAVARRYSLCADDAHDAYQRALEIFIRRADTLERETVVGWLKTVIKHEALAVREGRLKTVAHADIDLELQADTFVPEADEQAAQFDLLMHSAEALQRLKPQEQKALVLKAGGHSYKEICELTGWTYTKVNRCLSEGRKSFRDRLIEIRSGEECRRWSVELSALADNSATSAQAAAIRPHLRNCSACRALLAQMRDPARLVAGLLPLPLLPELSGAAGAGLFAKVVSAFSLAKSKLIAAVGLRADSITTVATGGGMETAAGGSKLVAGCAAALVACTGVIVPVVVERHKHPNPESRQLKSQAGDEAATVSTADRSSAPAGQVSQPVVVSATEANLNATRDKGSEDKGGSSQQRETGKDRRQESKKSHGSEPDSNQNGNEFDLTPTVNEPAASRSEPAAVSPTQAPQSKNVTSQAISKAPTAEPSAASCGGDFQVEC